LSDIKIYQTRLFQNQKKKLKKNQIEDLDKAIKSLLKNPKLGKQKSGNLSGAWVYEFSMLNQQYLLAYSWDEKSRTLVALGVHENFYRDLKRSIRF
jgi:mRNA-degrading endonuclease YafQ of YafQ-DinJ toxin-antitoxin module